MEFLSQLPADVKLLLVGAALALLAALLSGSKKKEHRYVAIFALLMVAAGYRFHTEMGQASADDTGRVQAETRHASVR